MTRPAPDPGQEDPAEGLEPPGPEVAGGLHQPEIELLGGGVDGQDGERQERIDRDQDDGPGVIEERGLGSGQSQEDEDCA